MMRMKFILPLATALMLPLAAHAKTLVFCSEGSPEGFDPALYTSGTTFDVTSRQVYSQLVEFERGTTTIIPGLAESWDISVDGLEYTFKLRQGVKFQSVDGFTPTRDFNADDVVFSLMRQKDKDHPWHQYTAGTSWEYFNSMSMPDLLKNVVKVDDYTVKIVLNKPQAPMIANLGMQFASILSAEYADKLQADGKMEMLNQQPVGTGPFQMIAYQKDAVVRFKAHPDYWRGKTPIDDLIFAITTDPSVRYQKMKAGECQVIAYPNPADLESMRADPNINVLEQEGLNVGYLAYNTTQAPFDNVKVRKALNMAINKEAIIQAVFQGAGKIAKNPIPPTIWSYNDAVKDDPYDAEAAKKMLEEAGVKDLRMKIWAMPVQRPYNPNARRMAELIQADFSKVGVGVEIVSYEWGEYLKLSKEKNRDGAVLLGWTGDNGDPDNFFAVLLGCDGVGGANRAQWCYQPFEDLIQKAKVVSDKAERTKLYEEAQVIFKEQAPWATIAHSVRFQPVLKQVKGFKIDPLGGHIFYGVDLQD
jgi:dipeptide transport system substrate-binding protein